jgi:hypothetical protein
MRPTVVRTRSVSSRTTSYPDAIATRSHATLTSMFPVLVRPKRSSTAAQKSAGMGRDKRSSHRLSSVGVKVESAGGIASPSSRIASSLADRWAGACEGIPSPSIHSGASTRASTPGSSASVNARNSSVVTAPNRKLSRYFLAKASKRSRPITPSIARRNRFPLS